MTLKTSTALAFAALTATLAYADEKPRLRLISAPAATAEPAANPDACPLAILVVPLAMPYATPPLPRGCEAAPYQTMKLRRGADTASFNAGLLEVRAGACRQLHHIDAVRQGPVIAAFTAAQERSLKVFGDQLKTEWVSFMASCTKL